MSQSGTISSNNQQLHAREGPGIRFRVVARGQAATMGVFFYSFMAGDEGGMANKRYVIVRKPRPART